MIKNSAKIFLVLCVVISVLSATISGANSQGTANNNAATYYLRAVSLLKYPTEINLSDEIVRTIKNGWPKSEQKPELSKILKENKPALKELSKGFLIKRCDFDFGQSPKRLFTHQLPPSKKLRNLARLLLARARQQERNGDFSGALESSTDSLTFAHHIAQYNAYVFKLLSLAIEDITVHPLKSVLASPKLSHADRKRALKFLQTYKQERFPPTAIIESHKEWYLSLPQEISDHLTKEGTSYGEAFGRAITEEASTLANQYYGKSIKAARTNKPEDWIAAQKVLKEGHISESGHPDSLENCMELARIRGEAWMKSGKARQKEIARNYDLFLLAGMGMPDFEVEVKNYYGNLKSLILYREIHNHG